MAAMERRRKESGRLVGGEGWEEGEGRGLMTATGEGGSREYWYYRTETGDARVVGLSFAETI